MGLPDLTVSFLAVDLNDFYDLLGSSTIEKV